MGIFSAIASIGSTILGNHSAKREAQRDRDWQEHMSNTSIQRRMADLKAAGLNPLLAVQSASAGASTPSGAQADIKHFDPTTITTMMNGLASAKLTKAQATAQEQENTLFKEKEKATKLQNELLQQGIWTAEVERKFKEAQTESERVKILTEAYNQKKIDADTKKIIRETELLGVQLNDPANSPIGQDMRFFGNLTENPLRLVGALTGGTASIGTRLLLGTAKALYNWANKDKKKGDKK